MDINQFLPMTDLTSHVQVNELFPFDTHTCTWPRLVGVTGNKFVVQSLIVIYGITTN